MPVAQVVLKNQQKVLKRINKLAIFASAKANGTLTEWLGSGLQNHLRQFESARYLFLA